MWSLPHPSAMDDAVTGSKPSVADGRSSSRLGGATDHQVEETEVLLGEGVSARKPVVAQASSRYHHYHFSHLNEGVWQFSYVKTAEFGRGSIFLSSATFRRIRIPKVPNSIIRVVDDSDHTSRFCNRSEHHHFQHSPSVGIDKDISFSSCGHGDQQPPR